MRIIAGEFRGRSLKASGDRRARPTADRVREAWFSILAPHLPGARVLDLFAGSGALGLEALSRGARHVDFVEVSKASLAALRANVALLDVEDRVTMHREDALRFVERLAVHAFDVALADPPYRTDAAQRLAAAYRRRPFAALLCVEHSAKRPVAGDETRTYGDSALTFLRASAS
ncbi:MAG TPA: 16S rRNA (guanine(966)-N(2))-methyltransferase RsmD [Gemmatimonadales bacterium]|nr:16S rRNA (guanine(966)-N(2))-methyltransferase RsmD [Gemmatimonadales bacterium]